MTAWQVEKRLKERSYKDRDAENAFRSGYFDGYYGYAEETSHDPNAYSAGYWEGRADTGRVDRGVKS